MTYESQPSTAENTQLKRTYMKPAPKPKKKKRDGVDQRRALTTTSSGGY